MSNLASIIEKLETPDNRPFNEVTRIQEAGYSLRELTSDLHRVLETLVCGSKQEAIEQLSEILDTDDNDDSQITPDNSVDLTIIYSILEDITERDATLEEVKRRLWNIADGLER